MSICPTNDLHSIYLDNEMPEAYKAEYESHIKVCPECQRKLENLRKLHGLFEVDSEAIAMSDEQLEKSYEKLMARMSYSKNVHKAEKKAKPGLIYVLSAAAAAMVFALIIPLRLNTKDAGIENQNATVASTMSTSSMQPVTSVSVGGGNGVIISGNLQSSVMQVSSVNSANNTEGLFFTDVDVFRPSFSGDNAVSIKITLPGMNSVFVPVANTVTEDEAGQTE